MSVFGHQNETETSRTTDRFESLTHAFSSYESRHRLDEEPFMRGVNSIQLLDDGKRWWILSIAWPRRRAVLSEPH